MIYAGHSMKRFLIILPVLWSALLVVFFIICGLELGRLPIPSFDDPKGFDFEILHVLLWTGLAIVVYSFPLVVAGILFLRKRLSISSLQTGIYLSGVYMVIYLMVLDPMRILAWFMD